MGHQLSESPQEQSVYELHSDTQFRNQVNKVVAEARPRICDKVVATFAVQRPDRATTEVLLAQLIDEEIHSLLTPLLEADRRREDTCAQHRFWVELNEFTRQLSLVLRAQAEARRLSQDSGRAC